MKIDGVVGNVVHPTRGESGWVRVSAFKFQFSKATTGSAKVDLLNVGKGLDKASPSLFLALCEGTEIPNIEVSVVQQPEEATTRLEVMTYKLTGASLNGIGGENGTKESESVQIDLGEEIDFSVKAVEWTYIEFEYSTGVEIGRVSKGWDFENNKAL